MGLGGGGHQGDVGERAGPGLGDSHTGIRGGDSLDETADIGAGVTDFYGTRHTDGLFLREETGDHTVELQGDLGAADGYFAADRALFRGSKPVG